MTSHLLHTCDPLPTQATLAMLSDSDMTLAFGCQVDLRPEGGKHQSQTSLLVDPAINSLTLESPLRENHLYGILDPDDEFEGKIQVLSRIISCAVCQ